MKTLIIAEAGVNHNGDIAIAKKLIEAAADCGADVVKFQTFKAENLVSKNAQKAAYQQTATGNTGSQFEMLKALELSAFDHEVLIQYCKKFEIEFFSTAFDLESINLLATIPLSRWKIPSGEITNLPYLRKIGKLAKPVILSTGMATLGEVEQALRVLIHCGVSRDEITVLHCNTEYPTPYSDVNLRAMISMREAFQVKIGYSDHTAGIEIPVAAVALGAQIIEKHFTLDHNMAGPDHKASLEPAEFKRMVSSIRNIEAALGNGIKSPSSSEMKNATVARKSIVAAQPINAGDKFTETNIAAKRPATGISPMQWDQVIGKTAGRNFAVDEAIEL